jgi:MarR family transcriptional regulator, organic hydroperoxide resistance regulator
VPTNVAQTCQYANKFRVRWKRDACRDPPVPSPKVEGAIEGWLSAMAWQRAVDHALRSLQLTHTQFLVLYGAAVATAETGDAVCQQDIADAAGLDRQTTSALVRKLDEVGLLDKNIHGLDGRMYRIFVTKDGHARLEKACQLLDQVAAALG